MRLFNLFAENFSQSREDGKFLYEESFKIKLYLLVDFEDTKI
jgi:hypothetical protein